MYSTGNPCPEWAPPDGGRIEVTFDSDGERAVMVTWFCDDYHGAVRHWGRREEDVGSGKPGVSVMILREDGMGDCGGSAERRLRRFSWRPLPGDEEGESDGG